MRNGYINNNIEKKIQSQKVKDFNLWGVGGIDTYHTKTKHTMIPGKYRDSLVPNMKFDALKRCQHL